MKTSYTLRSGIFALLFVFLSFHSVFAQTEDTSVLDELNKNKVQTLNIDFKMKTFQSCEKLEDTMKSYIKEYWKNNQNRYAMPVLYKMGGISEPMMLQDVAQNASVVAAPEVKIAEKPAEPVQDFSQTNIQVQGVDEAESVKTDGSYIYYYNQADHYVYIVKTGSLEIIKKIQLPETFSAPVLYVSKNRLVILASGYSDINYMAKGYFINRNSKTYTIVFDTTDMTTPKLVKLYISDGDFSQSRKIGNYVYVVSQNSFNIPYYNFQKEEDIQISADKILPKQVDITSTSIKSNQNLSIHGKNLPYSVSAGNVADCSDIEYVLPDAETIKKYDFSPSYNIISVINIDDFSQKVTTKVIAGSNVEMYMSQSNIYFTSPLYTLNNFSCPMGAYCIMPWYRAGENTLIHKINVKNNQLTYQNSTILPGTPLNQYSMDEKDSNFRILTHTWEPKETGLYILDNNLKLLSSLTGLGKKEDFKSSRFIGDKLFLTTFQQIDPLFAIDISDVKNPKILGELKIPGYSTYLHPYDATHLIGLGYDTKENKNGGVYNDGIKIDLYEMNFTKKCGDTNLTQEEKGKCDTGEYKGMIVKQVASTTLGEYGSYSDALNNPRVFVWNDAKKTLLLPATTYVNDADNYYTHKDFFQGLYVVQIDATKGISQKYSLTHLDIANFENDRKKECGQYSVPKPQSTCKKLINGEEYCAPQPYTYIPDYCYADAPIGQYIASTSWNYANSFINRALWIGDDVYAISNKKITISDFNTSDIKKSTELK